MKLSEFYYTKYTAFVALQGLCERNLTTIVAGPCPADYGFPPLGNNPLPPHRVNDSPQVGADLPDLRDMRLASSSVAPVRGSDPRLAFGRSGSRGAPAVQSTPVRARDGGVLAGRAPACFSETALARPVGPEPRCLTSFNELFEIHWC